MDVIQWHDTTTTHTYDCRRILLTTKDTLLTSPRPVFSPLHPSSRVSWPSSLSLSSSETGIIVDHLTLYRQLRFVWQINILSVQCNGREKDITIKLSTVLGRLSCRSSSPYSSPHSPSSPLVSTVTIGHWLAMIMIWSAQKWIQRWALRLALMIGILGRYY